MTNPRRADSIAAESVGEQLMLFDYVAFGGWRGGVELTGLSVRIPEERMAEVLVVLRGIDHEGAPVVAFHSAVGIAQALSGAATRLSGGSLKWKADQYANR